MRRIFVFIFVISGMTLTVQSQQQVMFTQYMFNGLAINPAYAGSHETISMTALSRIQWVGIDGAPNTQTFSIHTPVPGKNMGLGALFVRDKIGVTTENNVFLSYAYRLQTKAGVLSMGLQGGFSNVGVSFSDLSVDDSNLSGSESIYKPNFGLGLYYVTKRFYAGISSPYLLRNETSSSSMNQDLNSDQIQHYYFTGGVLFTLSPFIKVKPSFLVKTVAGAPLEFDINANLLFDEKVWLGFSYRSQDSFNILFELQLNQQLRLGYAYDITTTALRSVSAGSHEILLNYRLSFSRGKVITPRYF